MAKTRWIAGFLGMLISCIGLDPIYGYQRFTYNIVGLIRIMLIISIIRRFIDLNNRYIVSIKNLLDNRNSSNNIFWSLLTLRLVLIINLKTEWSYITIESNSNMCRFFRFNYVVNSSEETKNGRGVKTFRIYKRILHKSKILPVNL